jgi:hypothetical protein
MSDIELFFAWVDKWFYNLFNRATITPMNEEPTPQPAEPSPVVATPVNRFLEFCDYIKPYEGANPANNNPYNFKYFRGGYLPKYGVVKCSVGGFAMFSTLALGEEYGQTSIMEMIMNHPEWSFLDFFSVYAPPSDDNDTEKYASTIAAEMKVVASANLKDTLNL